MDAIRVCYRQRMTRWPGDTVGMLVEWQRADPGAKVLPGLNAYCSSNWDSAEDVQPVGEQWPRVRTYAKGANVLGYPGRSFCGSLETWAEGATSGVTPLITTAADGSSTCCGRLAQSQAVGVAPGSIDRTWWTSAVGHAAGALSDQTADYMTITAVGVEFGGSSSQSASYSTSSLVGVCVGAISAQEADVPYTGELRYAIPGSLLLPWAQCDGSILVVAANPILYSLIGNTYGGTPGVSFGLPDLRGRVPMAYGAGPGLTARALGDVGGQESVTLASGQYGAAPHTHAPGGGGSNFVEYSAGSGGGLPPGLANVTVGAVTAPNTDPGASVPTPTMQPWLCVGAWYLFTG